MLATFHNRGVRSETLNGIFLQIEQSCRILLKSTLVLFFFSGPWGVYHNFLAYFPQITDFYALQSVCVPSYVFFVNEGMF